MKSVTALMGIDVKERQYFDVTFDVPDDIEDTEEAYLAAFHAFAGDNAAAIVTGGDVRGDGEYEEYDADSIGFVELTDDGENAA